MQKKLISTIVAASLVVSACATHPDKISADYVPASRFESLTCDQMQDRMREIDARVAKLTGRQLKANKTDNWAFWGGMLLFWPALFIMPFTDDVKAELEQAKGEQDAILEAAREKGCY